MKKFLSYLTFAACFMGSAPSIAAIPFVTDDAGLANENELVIEAFTENWSIPKEDESRSADMIGQYLGLSYGVAKNLELTLGNLVGYDVREKKTSNMNPILQLKSIVFSSKKPEIPSLAISAAYVNNNGRGQYYDSATNFYLMGIATSKFFDDDLIVHVNFGPKESHNIDGQKTYRRMHLGVAADVTFFRKDVRIFAEGFNGAPNSPRDSSGYFKSYQAGFKFIKSPTLSFHILYGNQPTFNGYSESNAMTYRRTSWVQLGIRKAIDDFF